LQLHNYVPTGNGYIVSVYTHNGSWEGLLIKFRNTPVTLPAVLASQWHPKHAVYAEVLLVVFPQAKKFIHDPLLLASACWFRNVTRILSHTESVKIRTKTVGQQKE